MLLNGNAFFGLNIKTKKTGPAVNCNRSRRVCVPGPDPGCFPGSSVTFTVATIDVPRPCTRRSWRALRYSQNAVDMPQPRKPRRRSQRAARATVKFWPRRFYGGHQSI